ncbi:MAG TPA: type VI secretion system baseplate subunit TssF [Polyangiaceae bacterium]|nr:type VI secretion system baseplate subunit TssF [Polyangiaceae bacterium]
MSQDPIERAFLTELEALEKFRIAYTAQYPSVPLSHDDPDVRRMIEALAFFTARTRQAALRGLDESVQRVFRQHFPALLGPCPAMAMLRAVPSSTFTELTELPRGTEVLLREAPDEYGAGGKVFRFKTLADLTILPLSVRAVELSKRRGQGFRLLIRLVMSNPTNHELASFRLHVNHLDDLRSSITVLHELRTHLRGASVLYDPKAAEDAMGAPCQVSFGSLESEEELPDPFESPLQRARLRLRFPRQELFLNVAGLRPPRNWQHLTLCLDLSDEWPRKLRLTADGFELHAVPMINVTRSMANPVLCDGTKDRYPIHHPDDSGEYAPLWVIGAYRPTKQGFVPIAPGVMGSGGDRYEVVSAGRGNERRAWVMLNLQGAFQKPEPISIDGFWYQPGLRAAEFSELSVGLHAQFVEGVSWQCSGPLVPDAESALDGDRDAQLQLVSLKTVRFLSYDQLMLLVRACGAADEPLFAPVVAGLRDVQVSDKPHGTRGRSLKYTYELRFESLEKSDRARLSMFCAWLLRLLTTWSVEEVVEIVAVVRNWEQPLQFR